MKKGFTLIELLVVIVIVGILSAISIAGFSNFQAKGRDSARQASVAAMAKIIIADGLGSGRSDDAVMFYNGPMARRLFAANSLTPTIKNDHCYVVMTFGNMGGLSDYGNDSAFVTSNFNDPPNNTSLDDLVAAAGGGGDDNELLVFTWGETTSTQNPGTPGIIFNGTAQAVASAKTVVYNVDLTEDDFECSNILNTSAPNNWEAYYYVRDAMYGYSGGTTTRRFSNASYFYITDAALPEDLREVWNSSLRADNDFDIS